MWPWPTSCPRVARRTPSTTDLVEPPARSTRSPTRRGSSELNVLVGGQTAIFDDFSNVLANKLPLFIGVVVLLSFLLLMAVFRSLVDPGDGVGDEPAVGRRRVRHHHGDLPVGLGRVADRRRPHRSDRGLPAGDGVRDPVRPVDGLRGVPRQPHLRGVAQARGQRRGDHPRPRPRPAARSPPPRRSWCSSSRPSSSAASGSSSCSASGWPARSSSTRWSSAACSCRR